MQKSFIILMCLTFGLISGYAQTEIKRDSISINQGNKLPQTGEFNEYRHQVDRLENTTPLDEDELKRRAEFVKKLQFTMPQFYVGPPTENRPLNEKLPFANDYSFYGYQDLGNDFYWGGGSSLKTYPTIGAMQIVQANLNYQPSDWFSISGGMYGTKYNAYGQHYQDVGFNASLRIKLHDRIYLHGHGNYSINAKYLGPATTGMFPQTYYGGGIEFKINDSFGLEGGMIREFNPMKRKWENIPYLLPIFYSNGRRR